MTVTVNNEEALKRRCDRETPLETAARLRAEFRIKLSKQAREALPRQIYDELSGEN
jgi:antitoxin VapB